MSVDSDVIHESHEIIFCEKCHHPNVVTDKPYRRRTTRNRHVMLDDVVWNILTRYKEIYGSYSNALSIVLKHHNDDLPILNKFQKVDWNMENNNKVEIQ